MSLAFFLRSSNMNPHCRFFFHKGHRIPWYIWKILTGLNSISPSFNQTSHFPHSLIPPSHTAAQRVYMKYVFMTRYFISIWCRSSTHCAINCLNHGKPKIQKKNIYIYIYIYIHIYIHIYTYIHTHIHIYILKAKETRYTRFVQERTFSVFLAVTCESGNEP